MATVFDLALLEEFSSLFTIILVYVIVYGVLEVGGFLKNKGLNAVIALAVALLVALSPNFTSILTEMMPWFVIMIFFLFFLWTIGLFLGFSSEDLIQTFGGKPGAFWWVFFFAAVALVFAISTTFGPTLLEDENGENGNGVNGENGTKDTGTGAFGSNLQNTLFHPKVLGLILILIIGSMAVRFLTSSPVIPGNG